MTPQDQRYGSPQNPWSSAPQTTQRLYSGTFREGNVPVALLSADSDRPTKWYRRPLLSNLSIIGILGAPFRRGRRGPSDLRLASSRRAAEAGGHSSAGLRQGSALLRSGLGATAGLMLLGGLLFGPDLGLGAGAPDFAVGRASMPASVPTAVDPARVPTSIPTAPQAERPGGEAPPGPRANVGAGAGVSDDSPRTPGREAPTSRQTPVNGPSPNRLPPPPRGAGPLAQVTAAASAGGDVRLGMGLGEGSCTGVKVGDLSIGCAPTGRDTFGATARTSGALLPPLVVSLP